MCGDLVRSPESRPLQQLAYYRYVYSVFLSKPSRVLFAWIKCGQAMLSIHCVVCFVFTIWMFFTSNRCLLQLKLPSWDVINVLDVNWCLPVVVEKEGKLLLHMLGRRQRQLMYTSGCNLHGVTNTAFPLSLSRTWYLCVPTCGRVGFLFLITHQQTHQVPGSSPATPTATWPPCRRWWFWRKERDKWGRKKRF